MHCLSELMQRREDGIYIDAPAGQIRLSPTKKGIKAEYISGPLVNGSATGRVESDRRRLRSKALLPLPLVEPDVRISRIRLSCKYSS